MTEFQLNGLKMTYKTNILAAALTSAFLATSTQAQDATPKANDMPMNKEQSMKHGDREDMMPMMKMMAQMGPMMEACTEMMQSMNDHMKAAGSEVDKG